MMLERIVIFFGVIFIIYAYPFVVGATIKMFSKEGYALMYPYDGLGYWLDGLGVAIVTSPFFLFAYGYISGTWQ